MHWPNGRDEGRYGARTPLLEDVFDGTRHFVLAEQVRQVSEVDGPSSRVSRLVLRWGTGSSSK